VEGSSHISVWNNTSQIQCATLNTHPKIQNFITINNKKSPDAVAKTVQQFCSEECFYNAGSMQTTWQQMVGMKTKDESEGIWKAVVVA
jgi:hypothetical protein